MYSKSNEKNNISQEPEGEVLEIPQLIEKSEEEGERQADILCQELDITSENSIKTKRMILSFVKSYKHKAREQSDVLWLEEEFMKYPNIWSSSEERKSIATEIIEQVDLYEASKRELATHHGKGLSTNHWLAKKIEQGAKISGVVDVGAYASEIDLVIDTANQANIDLLYRNDGQLNQQLNLDGFIAEQHHVNTFNINAKAKGSEYRAEVLKPKPGETYRKNSVDIVIKDRNGKIVKRYQAKYGSDANATKDLFEKGDYRGQRKLVPKGQAEDIDGSVDTIEMDNVQSEPLSKEEAKELQRKAQLEEEARQYDWNEVNRIDLTRNIAKKAGMSALLAVGFQGARILGRRIWNGLTNKENNSVEEDLRKFVQSSLKSAAGAGLSVAVTGGITVAVKSGWLGSVLKNTPAGRIANAVSIGIENAKILGKFAKGEISGEEALDQAGQTTCSLAGGILGGAKGATLGATLGTVLGPVGTVIGGIAGGAVGGMAGSTVAEAVYQGGKKIVKGVARAVKGMASSVGRGYRALKRGVSLLFG